MNLRLTALLVIATIAAYIAPAHARPQVLTDKLTVDTGGVIDIEGGKLKFDGVEITSTAAELNAIDGITATVDELNTAADASALDNAADTNSVAAIVETIQPIQKLTATYSAVVLTATDGSDEGESIKICDMPDGNLTILSAVANCSIISSAGATNTFVVALGTAAAGDDNALTSTEANIIPSTSIDTTAGTVLTNAFDAVLAAPLSVDGTSTAMALYQNLAIDDDNMDANVTNTFSGTVTLMYIDGGDNQ